MKLSISSVVVVLASLAVGIMAKPIDNGEYKRVQHEWRDAQIICRGTEGQDAACGEHGSPLCDR